MIWGSEAAGVAAYGRIENSARDLLRYRLGGFTLIEDGVALADDATLWVADAELRPAYAWDLGAHAWWLHDNTGGNGGSFGSGPTSQLSQLQGGPRLVFLNSSASTGTGTATAAEVDADLLWFSVDAGWNRDLDRGPLGLRGMALANLGRLYVTDQPDVDVRGWLLNGELRWRWTRGRGSELALQGLASSGDSSGSGGGSATDDGRYTGIVTGNSYGIVGAVWATHNTLLLFPDPDAINRQVAVVSDVSGAGRGLLAATLSLGFDPIPNRLTTRLTAAQAATASGQAIGTETGAALTWHPLPLFDVGLHGAVVTGARVADMTATSPATAPLTTLPAYPWAVLAHLQWVLF
ncbi:MAG: hypothetical protein GXP62_18985 [Oligoflexia bacterium]|nr:hypothetical protein [Oligoflexia bacterium]